MSDTPVDTEDEVEEGTDTESEATESTDVTVGRNEAFDSKEADRLYAAAMKQARATVSQEGKTDTARRELCFACFDFIQSIFPPLLLDKVRMAIAAGEQPTYGEVGRYMSNHQPPLPTPSWRSDNPFLPLFQHFYVRARMMAKTIDLETGDKITEQYLNDAQTTDRKAIKAAGRLSKAEGVMAGRYAKLLMIALEMDDRDQINGPFLPTFTNYTAWRDKNIDRALSDPMGGATPRPRPTNPQGSVTTTPKADEGDADEDAGEDNGETDLSGSDFDPYDNVLDTDDNILDGEAVEVTDDDTDKSSVDKPEATKVEELEAVKAEPEVAKAEPEKPQVLRLPRQVRFSKPVSLEPTLFERFDEMPKKGTLSYEIVDGKLIIEGFEIDPAVLDNVIKMGAGE